MVRFFNIIKNEYIKINKKVSTKIMLALLVLSTFMIPLLAMISQNYSYNYEADYVSEYKSQISWLNETKPEDYESLIDQYNLLLENNIGYDDWRYEMIMDTDFASLKKNELNQMKNIIASNDWKSFCQKRLEDPYLSAGKRWAFSYKLENNISYDEKYDKQNAIINNVSDAKDKIEQINSSGMPNSSELESARDAVLLGTYQLDNEILDNSADQESLFKSEDVTFWSVFMTNKMVVSVVGFIIIVLAGGIIAQEFSQGTIKFLLINPVKRWKILAAKYLTCITFGYILIAVVFAVSIPVTGFFVGFDGISTPYLYIQDGTVHEMSTFVHAIKIYLLSSVNMIVMSTLAFAISSLVRSSALAIGVSVFFMCVGNTVTLVLNQLGQDWGRYLIFANTDFVSISKGQSLFPSHTLEFALVVVIAHMAVFLLTAWDGFTKKSV